MTKDKIYKQIKKLNSKLENLRYEELMYESEITEIYRKCARMELEFDLAIERKHYSANQAVKNYFFAELCEGKQYKKNIGELDELRLGKKARGVDIKTAENLIDLLKLQVGFKGINTGMLGSWGCIKANMKLLYNAKK